MTNEQRDERNRLATEADVTTDMLIDGVKLRDAETAGDELTVLTTAGLDLFTRHIATLEGTDRLTMLTLKNLGAAEGLDLQRPVDVKTYALKIIAMTRSTYCPTRPTRGRCRWTRRGRLSTRAHLCTASSRW